MRLRRIAALSAGLLVVAGLLAPPPAAEAATKKPSAIKSVTAVSGSSPGTIVFRWTSAGKRTDYYLLETGLTAFSKSKKSPLPTSGRQARTFKISAKARSWTMSRAQSTWAGAPVGSGNLLYYRLTAVNKVGKKTYTKAYPYLRSAMPKGLPVSSVRSTDLRVATFNLMTAQLGTGSRAWLSRADSAAADILRSGAAVVLLQESSPGRADGRNAAIGTVGRQTTTLVDRLKSRGGSNHAYAMVRTTSYVNFSLLSGTQGGRILYDSKRVRLLSSCPEYTGTASYNSSCSFALPTLSTDSEAKRRRGAYALFESRSSGQRFWAFSAHLDERHSSNRAAGARYNSLRASQARAIVALATRVNTQKHPVILGADLNTWQNDASGYAGHDVLVSAGFRDAKAAATRVNVAYSTVNEFRTTVPRQSSGLGSHLDVVMVKGGKGEAVRWVNLLTNPNARRSSDHNLVWADVRI
jgi:endonuclease/exonuclease/phosphatase family metal-dependent hydrolase